MLAERQENSLQVETLVNTPGVYDISIENYHSGPGLSRSSLLEFQKSPFHFWYKLNNKEQKEPVDIIRKMNALDFGNALHTFILERETFYDRYVVMEKVNRTTKEGKSSYAAHKEFAEKHSRQIICKEAFHEIQFMSASIDTHPDARSLISDAVYEKSVYWNDPNTDLFCKVRPDIWHSNMICDLKTCLSGSFKDFQRSVISYGYHIQAGMIQEAIKHVLGEKIKNFVYVAIEKEPPYAVAIYQLDEMAVEEGIARFRHILSGVKQCIDENNWPSYQSGVINLPAWALR